MANTKQLKIRPYARLLTMLGDQLIKNERIALIELIKNSYDADADYVKVSFLNFKDNYEITPKSKIVIEDNGIGMAESIITKHWLNPATPEKKKRKSKNITTAKGRVIQGEKGIGRFAILKLGRVIKITTRSEKDDYEHTIKYDFSKYDDEFLTENGKDKELYIDNLRVSLTSQKPVHFIKKNVSIGTRQIKQNPNGTVIEISNLKGSWSEDKVKAVYRDISKLISIFPTKSNDNIFDIFIYRNEERQKFQEDYLEKLHLLLHERTIFQIKGKFNDKNNNFIFKINNEQKILSIKDPAITGLKVFKDRFGDAAKVLRNRKIECGSFEFGFFIFDFSSQVPPKYQLDKEDKEIIREHRIYLYRDDIRVYPYGDPEDDWLSIDIFRGTISAGYFLSNDQVVGHVNISHKNNPMLMDKTNREGLIYEGNATDDFVTLIQTFLAYIRQKPYARYRKDLEKKKEHDINKTEQVKVTLNKLKETVKGNKKAENLISKAEKEYSAERRYLTQRAETTEELAGVGLSVETASHDIMGIMNKVFTNLDGIIKDLMSKDKIDNDILLKELQSVRGGMSFIESQLKDIQLLFKSSKQRRKNIRVYEIIEKVERIYKRLLKKESIDLSINTSGSPLIAKTTDAVLLQLLLNLFDNSVYWLQQVTIPNKKIEILLDGNKGIMVFSDNGPGVAKDDIPYIFEPFYSGKGEEGRGLGLYIAKQLLERNDYSIRLAEIKSEKILSGANFVINFIAEE